MRKPIIENAYYYEAGAGKGDWIVVIKFQELPLFLEVLTEHLDRLKEYCFHVSFIPYDVCFGCSFKKGLAGLKINLVDFTKPLDEELEEDDLWTREEMDEIEADWNKDFREFLREKVEVLGTWQGACEGVTPFIKNRQDREFEWQVRLHENVKKIGEQTGGDEG